MLFNSLQYAIFLPVSLAGYFLLPERWRIGWLLTASCVFYMVYQPAYILVLAALIAIDFIAGLRIAASPPPRARQWLIGSIAATCAALFFFKYFDFAMMNLSWLARVCHIRFSPPAWYMPLPVGLSFHTFQSLAYVIEVYRGRQAPERNPWIYATYVMFFPQLVAGPIERPGNLLRQFHEKRFFDPEECVRGLKRIALGLFKKAVIADRLGLFVQPIFESPASFGGLEIALAAMAFSYQIYCDFSGYSDIAIGSARMLGFRLTENFDSPFAAESIAGFWRRWHMSLSNWFRDYVFIPLGGSRGSEIRTAVNYLVTFSLSGLWHGAAWHYVLWGTLNGAYLVLGRWTKPGRDRAAEAIGLAAGHPVRRTLAVVSTFCLTSAAFAIFRSPDLSRAFYVLTNWPRGWNIERGMWLGSLDPLQQAIAFGSIVLLELIQVSNGRPALRSAWTGLPPSVRLASYSVLVAATIFAGVFLDSGTFIYFQF